MWGEHATRRTPSEEGDMQIGCLAAATAITLAACTGGRSTDTPGTAEQAPSLRGGVMVAITGGGDVAIDAGTGTVLAGGEGTVAAPDGDALYGTVADDGTTTITTIDPRSGTSRGTVSVRGELGVAVASVSGDLIALVEPSPGGAGVPIPRAETTIIVADPAGMHEPMRFRLDGNYEPEAFSIDDERLFLIQYLPAETPAVYRVVVLELSTGAVRPVRGRFKTPPQRMPGVRLGQVFDPVTSQMYTLYSNEPGAYADAYEDVGGDNPYGGGSGSTGAGGYWPEETFVHVLNLRRGWAYCAGLPKVMWGGGRTDQAIVPSPDGRSLYVVDTRQGLVAVMDTESLEIVRTSRIDLGEAGGRASVSVSPSGATLFASPGDERGTVSAIDTRSMTLDDRWSASGPISGLGVASDGTALFAAVGGRIEVVDIETGESMASVPTPGLAPILSLEPLPQ
jgi:hypothetical protein